MAGFCLIEVAFITGLTVTQMNLNFMLKDLTVLETRFVIYN